MKKSEKGIVDAISPFVDPTDAKCVKIDGNRVIINETQVSRDRITSIQDALKDSETEVVLVNGDPSVIS